jgi:hypothetical protein
MFSACDAVARTAANASDESRSRPRIIIPPRGFSHEP